MYSTYEYILQKRKLFTYLFIYYVIKKIYSICNFFSLEKIIQFSYALT